MNPTFTLPQKAGFHLIGKTIVEHRSALLTLLRQLGWRLLPSIKPKALVGIVLESLRREGADFQLELSRLLSQYSNFTGAIPPASHEIPAIVHAVGSVAQLTKALIPSKAIKQAAEVATFQTFYKNNPLEESPAVPPQTKINSRKSSKRRQWIIGAGLFVASAIWLGVSVIG